MSHKTGFRSRILIAIFAFSLSLMQGPLFAARAEARDSLLVRSETSSIDLSALDAKLMKNNADSMLFAKADVNSRPVGTIIKAKASKRTTKFHDKFMVAATFLMAVIIILISSNTDNTPE